MTPQPAIQVGLLLPMALDAEAHLESLALEPIHLPDLAMARFAGDILQDMALMVEQHVLGQIEHLDPGRGGVGVEIIMLLPDLRMVGNDVIVTEKTFFHGRQAGMVRARHVGVAEAAVDGLVAGMQPVAERNLRG